MKNRILKLLNQHNPPVSSDREDPLQKRLDKIAEYDKLRKQMTSQFRDLAGNLNDLADSLDAEWDAIEGGVP